MLNKLKLWLLTKLFNESEKYLLIRAIEDRITYLQKISIENLFVDTHHTNKDIEELQFLRSLFISKWWK